MAKEEVWTDWWLGQHAGNHNCCISSPANGCYLETARKDREHDTQDVEMVVEDIASRDTNVDVQSMIGQHKRGCCHL